MKTKEGEQLKPINKQNVKIRNLLGLNNDPTYEDLLFEIVQFLENEGRYDGKFKKSEVSQKTKCRISTELLDDLKQLENKGYIEHIKYTWFKILKHPWEIEEEKNY
ncbi:MAG: hypothetical protein ACOC1O_01500 [bacterium]